VVNMLFLCLALFNLGINLGDALGPILGGVVTSSYGFEKSCVFIGIMNLLYSCIFAYNNLEYIKKHIYEPRQEETPDEPYEEPSKKILIGNVPSRRDSLNYTTRYRAMSFSNKSSKRSSFAF
jgi:hypothetical protein